MAILTTRDVVTAFVAAINAHDVEAIVGLCAADHTFIDAHGAIVPAERLHAAWTGYFGFMPLYGIELEEMLCQGEVAAIFGYAWGGLTSETLPERTWRRPCAWRSRVQFGKISLWQVYVDTKAVFDLL